jgi:phosphoribosylformimino-5-aminoimidazole carboxamide ribotide isomerase
VLIPSIDLQGGRIVQLVQGERLAVETTDIDGWIQKFAAYPVVQLIDLDAAKGQGDNAALVDALCERRRCQVGGGIRTVERARDLLRAGAHRVILGSALFSRDGVNLGFAGQLAAAIGPDRVIAAVDSRSGRVVIDGWRTTLPLETSDAIRVLEPFVSAFLYTHVDREGLLEGTDLGAVERLAAITARKIIAAGGITTMEEVDYLDSIGVDAVVGMAIYTGRLKIGR